jgi:hypothetical protein
LPQKREEKKRSSTVAKHPAHPGQELPSLSCNAEGLSSSCFNLQAQAGNAAEWAKNEHTSAVPLTGHFRRVQYALSFRASWFVESMLAGNAIYSSHEVMRTITEEPLRKYKAWLRPCARNHGADWI